jgi:PDZ domain
MGAKRLLLALGTVAALAVPLDAPCYGPAVVDHAQTRAVLSTNDSPQHPGLSSAKSAPLRDADEPGNAPVTEAAVSPPQVIPDTEPSATNAKLKTPAMITGRGAVRSLGALSATHDRSGTHAAAMDAPQTGPGQGMDAGVNPADVGLTVRALSDTERHDLGIAEGGLRVTSVAEGSAQNAGFRAGDVVLMLDGVAVTSPAQFRKLMSRLPHDRPVPVLVRRPNSNLFLPLDAPGR